MMNVREILEEIELVKERILIARPGTISHSDLVVAFVLLQDMAIKAMLDTDIAA